MKELKRMALRLFVGAEIVLVTFFYLCGSGGLPALKLADGTNSELLKEITQLESDITALTRELDERSKNHFYKESIARKELQMAYENETVYLLPKRAENV